MISTCLPKNKYYKYRPLYRVNDKGKNVESSFTKSIFTKKEIFFSTPCDVNDPFDCNTKLHAVDSTDEEWVQYIDNLISETTSFKDVSLLRSLKSGKLWKKNKAIVENIGRKNLDTNYNKSSLFCLSKTNNSIPMFSYYADSHQGIAIEFSFSDDEVPCGYSYDVTNGNLPGGGKLIFEDVQYLDAYPQLNYHRIRGTDALVKNTIFTKYNGWAHENEFRIFRRNIRKSTAMFKSQLLTRVIFGSRTTSKERKIVKSWLIGWPSDIILSKAFPSADTFSLDILDIDSYNA